MTAATIATVCGASSRRRRPLPRGPATASLQSHPSNRLSWPLGAPAAGSSATTPATGNGGGEGNDDTGVGERATRPTHRRPGLRQQRPQSAAAAARPRRGPRRPPPLRQHCRAARAPRPWRRPLSWASSLEWWWRVCARCLGQVRLARAGSCAVRAQGKPCARPKSRQRVHKRWRSRKGHERRPNSSKHALTLLRFMKPRLWPGIGDREVEVQTDAQATEVAQQRPLGTS